MYTSFGIPTGPKLSQVIERGSPTPHNSPPSGEVSLISPRILKMPESLRVSGSALSCTRTTTLLEKTEGTVHAKEPPAPPSLIGPPVLIRFQVPGLFPVVE